MAQAHLTKQFTEAVNAVIKIDLDLQKQINETFKYLKKTCQAVGLSVVKLSDFKYKSFYSKTKNIDLDIAVVKYFPPTTDYSLGTLNKQVLQIFEKLPIKYQVKKNNNYLIIAENFKSFLIKFRVVPMIRQEQNQAERLTKFQSKKRELKKEAETLLKELQAINAVDKLDKKNKAKQLKAVEAKQAKLNHYESHYYENKDTISRSGMGQEDLALQVTEAFVQANKISNQTLAAVKKLLNYVLKNQFKYTYNVDMLLLTWFYEFFVRSINVFLEKKINNSDKNLDIEHFLKLKNLKKWFKTNINLYDLYYFIFTKIGQVNTYYFTEAGFDEWELFKDISRYSLNTNSSFKIPNSVFLGFKIFNIADYEDLTFIQGHLDNEHGYSKIIYDKTRNEEKRYFASPLIVSGIANYPLFNKWLDQTASNLKMTLPDAVKKELESFRSREAMEVINAIGHNWLASYWAKLKYLAPYFDRKYPLASQFDFKTMILMITTMVDKTNEKNWTLKNDN